MKLKITIGIFVVILLGLFFLLFIIQGNDQNFDENAACEMYSSDEINEYMDTAEESVDADISGGTALADSVVVICSPAPLVGVSEQIIQKKAYVVSYNKDTKIPNWVAWHLTSEHTDGSVGRSNQFYEDEEIPSPRATLEDYRGSGWSRGHMCPAGDNKWDAEAMAQSFSLINVCPQNASLNSGLWNSIEIDCRRWANRFGDIYIVCGPLFYNKEHETIGRNNVYVPEAFFKVVLCLNGTPKAIGIVAKNNAGTKKRDLYYNTIDQVERMTGMDFFPSLPDNIEDVVEATADINDWN